MQCICFVSTFLYNLKYAPDQRNSLLNITTPTLIVWGDNVRMIPLVKNAGPSGFG